MNEKDILKLKESLTMPSEMADALIESCKTIKKPHTRYRRRNLCAAAAAVFCIFAVGSTSLAYNVYQEKQLVVFMDPDLSQAEIDSIGQKIADICDVPSCQYITAQYTNNSGEYASCRYISGDEAWEEFKAAYLTDESGTEMTDLTAAFSENPLADSFNYRVSVRINADTQAVRDRIGSLPGVRKIMTLREAKRADSEKN